MSAPAAPLRTMSAPAAPQVEPDIADLLQQGPRENGPQQEFWCEDEAAETTEDNDNMHEFEDWHLGMLPQEEEGELHDCLWNPDDEEKSINAGISEWGRCLSVT